MKVEHWKRGGNKFYELSRLSRSVLIYLSRRQAERGNAAVLLLPLFVFDSIYAELIEIG